MKRNEQGCRRAIVLVVGPPAVGVILALAFVPVEWLPLAAIVGPVSLAWVIGVGLLASRAVTKISLFLVGVISVTVMLGACSKPRLAISCFEKSAESQGWPEPCPRERKRQLAEWLGGSLAEE